MPAVFLTSRRMQEAASETDGGGRHGETERSESGPLFTFFHSFLALSSRLPPFGPGPSRRRSSALSSTVVTEGSSRKGLKEGLVSA